MPQSHVNHWVMAKFILLILLFLSDAGRTWAQSVAADDIGQLQKQMYQLYNKGDEAASSTLPTG